VSNPLTPDDLRKAFEKIGFMSAEALPSQIIQVDGGIIQIETIVRFYPDKKEDR
jgi:hypothetical protein